MMDVLMRQIQNEVSWCMLFVDDIILIDETREELTLSWRFGDKP